MRLPNLVKYPAFIIAGLISAIVLVIVSDWIGFSRTSLVPLSGPSYAGWVYPIYFFISFIIFSKIFDLPKRAKYYILAVAVIFTIWLHFVAFEGSLFTNPIPFGVGAI